MYVLSKYAWHTCNWTIRDHQFKVKFKVNVYSTTVKTLKLAKLLCALNMHKVLATGQYVINILKFIYTLQNKFAFKTGVDHIPVIFIKKKESIKLMHEIFGTGCYVSYRVSLVMFET